MAFISTETAINGFVPVVSPELPSDPFPITIIKSNGSDYEYARRHTTLGDPFDVSSLATGRLAIVGVQTEPSFYKSIDVVVAIAATISEHASVHSEPYLFTGISTNSTLLTNAWHFRADPFIQGGVIGIGTTLGVTKEYGFSFSKQSLTSLAINSYGFYYGTPGFPITTGNWGVFIDDDVPNYYEDLVLIGNYSSVGSASATQPEPILQVFDNNEKKGAYVESVMGVGILPDTRYQVYIQKSIDAIESARLIGDVYVDGEVTLTGSLNANVSGDVTGDVTGSISGGNVSAGVVTSTTYVVSSSQTSTDGTSSSFTVDSSLSQYYHHVANFDGNKIFNISNLTDGRSIYLYLRNTDSTNRTITINASATTSGYSAVNLSRSGSSSISTFALNGTTGTAVVWLANMGNNIVGSIY